MGGPALRARHPRVRAARGAARLGAGGLIVIVKLIALVLPLGLDTFAVAAALGVTGLDPKRRLRVYC